MDRTVLITGATSGVGRYVAERLADRGATILAHGRDLGRLDGLVAELGGRARPHVADLASLDAVAELTKRVRADHDRLDVLINNAGVGSGVSRTLTVDGHELHFAVNYLAPVLLTRELLPLLRASAPAEVVNVGSLGQDTIDFHDLTMERRYDGGLGYARSKLALAAHTFDLAEEVEDDGITVNCIHPATFMDTAMVRQAGITPRSTIAEGGDAVLRLITEETGTGLFFDGMSRARAHPDAYDPDVRRRLHDATERLLASFG